MRRVVPECPRLLLGRRVLSGLGLIAAVGVVILFGCREETATQIDRNRPPDTYLTGAPAESSLTVYRVHLFWYGNDPDGVVTGYQFAITDSLPRDEDTLTYSFTSKTDSVFVFPVGKSQQVLGHRFYIRAIDDEGRVDPEPAWTFFSVADLVPPETILLAVAFDPITGERDTIWSTSVPIPKDTVNAGWNVRFQWRGVDNDRVILETGEVDTIGVVTGYEYWLSPRQASPVHGGPNDTLVVHGNLQSGKYQFNLRAIDEAGFGGLDPTIRTFVWNHDPITYFEKALNPSSGKMTPHFFASSQAWSGEREFFDGDTVPLVRLPGGTHALVDLRAIVYGEDPDDVLGTGVSGFQYRPGSGLWRDVADAENPTVLLEKQNTAGFVLQARCADGYGRRDGSPAGMRIAVNRAPILLRTVSAGPPPVLERPFPGEEIALDSLIAWGGVLKVRFLAWDPDSTTDEFEYAFRTGGFIYEAMQSPPAGQICQYDLRLPEDWLRPRTDVALGVRVREIGPPEPRRQAEIRIPFTIVE